MTIYVFTFLYTVIIGHSSCLEDTDFPSDNELLRDKLRETVTSYGERLNLDKNVQPDESFTRGGGVVRRVVGGFAADGWKREHCVTRFEGGRGRLFTLKGSKCTRRYSRKLKRGIVHSMYQRRTLGCAPLLSSPFLWVCDRNGRVSRLDAKLVGGDAVSHRGRA